MFVFIWKKIEECSNSYHKDGGVVIIAPTIERARELAFYEDSEYDFEKKESIRFVKPMRGIDKEPDFTIKVSDDIKEQIIVFPDSGCC